MAAHSESGPNGKNNQKTADDTAISSDVHAVAHDAARKVLENSSAVFMAPGNIEILEPWYREIRLVIDGLGSLSTIASLNIINSTLRERIKSAKIEPPDASKDIGKKDSSNNGEKAIPFAAGAALESVLDAYVGSIYKQLGVKKPVIGSTLPR